MDSEAKEVPLGIVLTATTGRMLCQFDDFHDFIEYMAGESVWTHQIPRVGDEVALALLSQHPGLADVEVPDFDFPDDATREDRAKVITEWLDQQTERYGKVLLVKPLPVEQHESRDPLKELLEMTSDDAKIVVVAVGGEEADDVRDSSVD